MRRVASLRGRWCGQRTTRTRGGLTSHAARACTCTCACAHQGTDRPTDRPTNPPRVLPHGSTSVRASALPCAPRPGVQAERVSRAHLRWQRVAGDAAMGLAVAGVVVAGRLAVAVAVAVAVAGRLGGHAARHAGPRLLADAGRRRRRRRRHGLDLFVAGRRAGTPLRAQAERRRRRRTALRRGHECRQRRCYRRGRGDGRRALAAVQVGRLLGGERARD